MNWYVIALLDGGYIMVSDERRPDPAEPIIAIDIAGNKWGIPAHRFKVAYGPCSDAEASEFMSDVSGFQNRF